LDNTAKVGCQMRIYPPRGLYGGGPGGSRMSGLVPVVSGRSVVHICMTVLARTCSMAHPHRPHPILPHALLVQPNCSPHACSARGNESQALVHALWQGLGGVGNVCMHSAHRPQSVFATRDTLACCV
jgi:hypothetical protein